MAIKGRRPKNQQGATPSTPVFSAVAAYLGEFVAGLEVQPSPMNKMETAWALGLEVDRLEGRVIWWGFQAFKVRLGAGAWYTPDFFVVMSAGTIRIDEVKGHSEAAARVRIKVAAGLYPFFEFQAVKRKLKRDGGGWDIEAIKSHHTLLEPK